VLSVLFIDRVANYRTYAPDGSPIKGKFAFWSEEIFEGYQAKPEYAGLYPFDADQAHNGYNISRRTSRGISRTPRKRVPAVSARLGHSSIRTTAEIYAHAIHGSEDDAVQKWKEYQQRNRMGSQPAKGVQ
jgi:hypothetical protein